MVGHGWRRQCVCGDVVAGEWRWVYGRFNKEARLCVYVLLCSWLIGGDGVTDAVRRRG